MLWRMEMGATAERIKNKEIIAVYSEKGVLLDFGLTDSRDFYYEEALLEAFRANPARAIFYFGFEDGTPYMSPSLAFLHAIAQRFITELSHDADIEITRESAGLNGDDTLDIVRSVPFAVGMEYVRAEWVNALWADLSEVFVSELGQFEGSVADFLKSHDPKINTVGRVFFHLVENKMDSHPFAFLATYATKSEQSANGAQDTKNARSGKVAHVPLKNALLEYQNDEGLLLKLLATVSKAADCSGFISELVESGELFSPLRFTSEEAYTFLKEIPLYEECGILCRIPDWWKNKKSAVKLSFSMGGKAPSMVGMDALLRFDPELYLGNEKISEEDIEALLSQASGLRLIKGKWVEVDHDKLKSALDAYRKAASLADLSMAEAMRFQLGLRGSPVSVQGVDVEIKNGEWLSNVRARLLTPGQIENLDAGEDFKATLRHYQQAGFDWLGTMKNLGFGALLADDMGLGKTVQILALLEYMRRNANFKALLIIPASLIGNWQSEIKKFSPKLKYTLLHSKNINVSKDVENKDSSANLFITTYGMATRLKALKLHKWDVLILDEAQAIKNPLTKQTKAVKQIDSQFKIAMTGTPVENKLSDLWSLFDFLNSGLLGTTKEFSSFTKQMQGKESYSRLREIISPFILRRLKTDKSIISDLPDKIEMKAFASLTKKQVVLYKDLVDEFERKLFEVEGIERKGLVLASIMKFKQICNHPDQYIGKSEFDPEHGGKFEKLKEICETIYEKRERLLVFTQFREMTAPISDYLETVFNRKGLTLHGGTPVNKRALLVDEFNGEDYVPYMVLSLKAGGVGLNLTAANHVVHFDRWWNPAVENQATDRAFRIGQRKNVLVHKFITTGTIEEKIDAMIESKQKLAGELIVSSGEKWITEMNNDELIRLFTLS